MNEPLLLRTLRGETVERPPVWIMRQAGRYLPEYRALKERYSFLELCRQPRLASDVTLMALDKLQVDAAILFSDILIPFEALGVEVDFVPGPIVKNRLRSPADVEQLSIRPAEEACPYVGEAVRMLVEQLSTRAIDGSRPALIGFSGAPWTLACYLLEQGVFKNNVGTLVFARRHEAAFHCLMEKLTTLVCDYLKLQIDAGCDCVQVFDSWAGVLDSESYRRYSLPYVERIGSFLTSANCPSILYASGGAHLALDFFETGFKALSLDGHCTLPDVYRMGEGRFTLQGNLEPTTLFLDTSAVYQRTRQMIERWPVRKQLIANLGHGILPETPVAAAEAFIRAVKDGWGNAA